MPVWSRFCCFHFHGGGGETEIQTFLAAHSEYSAAKCASGYLTQTCLGQPGESTGLLLGWIWASGFSWAAADQDLWSTPKSPRREATRVILFPIQYKLHHQDIIKSSVLIQSYYFVFLTLLRGMQHLYTISYVIALKRFSKRVWFSNLQLQGSIAQKLTLTVLWSNLDRCDSDLALIPSGMGGFCKATN